MNEFRISCRWLPAGTAAVLSATAGLLASRILFEGLFPSAAWLGRPDVAVLTALLFAIAGLLVWASLEGSLSRRAPNQPADAAANLQEGLSCSAAWQATLPFLPFLLAPIYILDSGIDLVGGRLLLIGCLWLSAILVVRLFARSTSWRWLGPLLLLSVLTPIYLLTMGRSVGTADTFEFQVVIPRLGIVHPTGYPLYLLLAKPFTFLPLNSVAWRVNLATAVFGLAAACLLFWLLWQLQRRPLAALLGALLFGLSPTFWSQAIEAEVYSLHALVVVSALFLMREIGGWRLDRAGQKTAEAPALPADSEIGANQVAGGGNRRLRSLLTHPLGQTVALALILGLGLTNHLTTLILLPAALLTILLAWRSGRFRDSPYRRISAWALVLAAFLLPLLLYAYLPLRWSAVNGEPMGMARFLDWVIGGRFQGALQLRAWLEDGARYGVVGRLFGAEWHPTWLLIIAFTGVAWSFLRSWHCALILLVCWLGFVFYALSYYVPDLAVFLIPAFMITAIWFGIGLGGIFVLLEGALSFMVPERPGTWRKTLAPVVSAILGVVAAGLIIWSAASRWSSVDASADDGRLAWADAVLSMPLEEGAAILADSDKFPPLYYLQQVDGLRPDLDILLLPDEAAYRQALTDRQALGQAVYLARFLPGLEGSYSLSSLGPLTRVAIQPSTALPEEVNRTSLTFGPIRLLGYELDRHSAFGGGKPVVTFYWSADEQLDEILQVYLRLTGESETAYSDGRHPANNYYPTLAWEPGEIVADFHALPEVWLEEPAVFDLEVAFGPPFGDPDQLDWTVVTELTLLPQRPDDVQPIRVQIGPNFLDGISTLDQARPGSRIPLWISGSGSDPEEMAISLIPSGQEEGIRPEFAGDRQSPQADDAETFIVSLELQAAETAEIYELYAAYPDQASRCGWLSRESPGCSLAEVSVTGTALPADAVNFDDKIALISVDTAAYELVPGGLLPVTLRWQALREMDEDYTVFIQVLDGKEHIAGQVDSWPLQGTFPTSQWASGEIIDDPYQVRLAADLAPGPYQMYIGWYLLRTLERLPVLDQSGAALDDKVVITGFSVP